MIQGKNLFLRPITIDDTDLIVKWRNSSSVRNNFVFRDELTRESHIEYFNKYVKTGKIEQFMIVLNDNSKPIGSIYLRDIDPKNRKAEFGIFIGETDNCGKGYGKEAASMICSYGFRELNLHKIMLRVFPYNKAAVNAYEKIGFVQEAYLKDELIINGEFYDMIFMALFEENLNMF